ncbi:hypothetical protein NB724_002955 [Pantoea ananatis]|nr:hypothetical protein [Pantoea ananatis]MCW0336190.1 hypothetical protein [Pantoea ananatis]MCW0384155.1 hypothetical protein [Pantoea ananatis]MCW0408799.1 hypothetical protein [Pantoea ananatis]MCW0428806.1 hypothetical protein [Pantoea ananatis]
MFLLRTLSDLRKYITMTLCFGDRHEAVRQVESYL